MRLLVPAAQLALACRIRESRTIAKTGHIASISALAPIRTTEIAAASRGERTASRIAPPGT